MSKNLLDLMPEADRKLALEKAEKRLARRSSKAGSVSTELYIVAQLGYYYGWEAVLAIRRGYTTTHKMEGGVSVTEREPFYLDEAIALIEAADKVWYTKQVDIAHTGMIGNTFTTQAKTFSEAVQPFTDKAETN